MILFTKPQTLFSFFLHISDLSPVMIITYTQKPRVPVLLSSKRQTCAYSKFCNPWSQYWPSPSACRWRRRLNPLLVDEGGSWPWQITSLFDSGVFPLLWFHAERKLQGLDESLYVLQIYLRLMFTLRSSCSSKCRFKQFLLRWCYISCLCKIHKTL